MEAQKVDMFIMANAKYFESHQLYNIRELLLKTNESRWGYITSIQFKDPTNILIVSILAGTLGIDRFIIGDVGLGVGKLITCGGLGIWALIDLFFVMGATKEKNLEELLMYVRQ
nr:TM2 domain-containing protein [uncultured Flavobacterium sp.]